MSTTIQDQEPTPQPGEGWTMTGIALVQLAQSINDLKDAATAIIRGDDALAHENVHRVIRQLDTAARMLT